MDLIKAFLLGIIEWGMGLKMVPGQVQKIVTGSVLIIALLLPTIVRKIGEIVKR